MNAIRTLSGDALRKSVLAQLAPAMQAIALSLGPNGRAALYSVGSGARRATSGTDIARRFTGNAAPEALFREAMVAAERDLGDGTARLAVMVEAAYRAGLRMIAAGAHPTQLIRDVAALRDEIDMHFAAVTRVDADCEAVLRAAGLDASTQRHLHEALRLAGPDGHVELTRTTDRELRLEHIEGFTADMEPLLSGEMGHMDRVYLLVANDIISDFRRLAPVIEGFARSDKALVIAARGLEGSARQLLERNRKAGVLRIVAITPADKGPRAAEILRDLACATGAGMVSEETGQTLETLTPEMLGFAESFRRSGRRITLTKPGGDLVAVAMRLNEIEAEIQRNRYLALDREHAQRRHARISGRWVELLVGENPGNPDLFGELSRALASVRSARMSGSIDGAGAGLSAVAELLESGNRGGRLVTAARQVVIEALRASGRHLRRNAGLEALDGTLPADGLQDPARLSRDALDTALSLALQLLSLETAVLRKR